jgi:hypothetical protein
MPRIDPGKRTERLEWFTLHCDTGTRLTLKRTSAPEHLRGGFDRLVLGRVLPNLRADTVIESPYALGRRRAYRRWSRTSPSLMALRLIAPSSS